MLCKKKKKRQKKKTKQKKLYILEGNETKEQSNCLTSESKGSCFFTK